MSLLIKKILEKIKKLDYNKISYGKKYNGIDLNSIDKTEVGDFDIYCTNAPFAGAGGYLITIIVSINYALQISINAINGDNYQRIKTNGTWQNWVKR